ncbi:homoserine O-succinyltransferase [Fructobacillus fructosus]|uniref:homoserine O-acetyltransferase/O-succinyltransferase family protein n=1 Tax=Fructobacillus fructosus TaxID=1631 RepID=UPI0002195772|nr:homoserine O-succinyltransferase [Fructobacillus fructosus]KRN53075.1 homoserine trans-succinylase [Fructobacillus fructosus KCTC 3544]GAP00853.1 homoserine O-succinyltransferase [Fructobacillus fructosus]
MGRINILNGYNKNADEREKQAIDLVIVNLMPTRAETEHQFISVLKLTPYNFNLTFAGMATHRYRHFERDIRAIYTTLDQIRDQKFDALIITGAPLDQIPFSEVDYWAEFQDWVNWRKEHVQTSLFTCWAAWAAGEIDRLFKGQALSHKICGIYQSNGYTIPHSRYFTIDQDSITHSATVLAGTKQLGATIVKEEQSASYYVTGHLEYSTQTLANEFARDQQQQKKVKAPENYFLLQGAPKNTWQRSTRRFFREWLAPFQERKLK